MAILCTDTDQAEVSRCEAGIWINAQKIIQKRFPYMKFASTIWNNKGKEVNKLLNKNLCIPVEQS